MIAPTLADAQLELQVAREGLKAAARRLERAQADADPIERRHARTMHDAHVTRVAQAEAAAQAATSARQASRSCSASTS